MDRGECLHHAAEYGYDHVEVLMEGDDAPAAFESAAAAYREAAATRDLDVLVHLPFTGIDIGSPFDPVRSAAAETQAKALDVAAEMGAEKAVLHPHTAAMPDAWGTEAVRTRLRDATRALVETAANRSIEAVVENLPRSVYSLDDFPKLLAGTEGAMTLNTAHARVNGHDAADMAAFVRDHPGLVSHVHLNDTRGPKDEHLPFGAGDTDFETVLSAFPDGWGETGTLSVEAFTDEFAYIRESGARLDAVLDALD